MKDFHQAAGDDLRVQRLEVSASGSADGIRLREVFQRLCFVDVAHQRHRSSRSIRGSRDFTWEMRSPVHEPVGGRPCFELQLAKN